jgi:hypothetical protein
MYGVWNSDVDAFTESCGGARAVIGRQDRHLHRGNSRWGNLPRWSVHIHALDSEAESRGRTHLFICQHAGEEVQL